MNSQNNNNNNVSRNTGTNYHNKINNNNKNKNKKNENNEKNDNNNNNKNNNNNNVPFRILTHNVQGLNSSAKQAQLIISMKQNDIAIMGLSETKIHNKNSKFIYRNDTDYDAFFDNSSSKPNGAGVGIVISKQYSKHIHKIESFKGRLISVDMF